MIIAIYRNHERTIINAEKDISVDAAMKREGYIYVNVLDIDNRNGINWHGIEFNRLFSKGNSLYRFNHWLGEYPYKSFEIEKIGIVMEEN